jgi:acyl-CoA reductase-like NAD-dependent aldehyde dehydrogenase
MGRENTPKGSKQFRVVPEVAAAVADTSLAAPAWGRSPSLRARMLDSAADALASARDRILATCCDETALTTDELAPEFDRMTGTLRMFAGIVREGSWVRACIDTATRSAIGPGHDVRRMLVPLGPVGVFGASNFPLAYGVCGGDTASALAAGCPVIVKEHPAHPRTGRLIHSLAIEGAGGAGAGGDGGGALPLSYINNEDPADLAPAQSLVRLVAAVGFTGSTRAGNALDRLARERPEPIPVFAEMGSVNPVLVTRAAARTRGAEIGTLLAESILARFGQQCTCPGIIQVPHSENGGAELVGTLAARIAGAPGRDMLAPWIRDSYAKRLREVESCRGVQVTARGQSRAGPRAGGACLFSVGLDDFVAQPSLSEEIFGPAAVVVDLPDEGASIGHLGALTMSVFFDAGDGGDVEMVRRLLEAWPPAGRVILNGVPTGVRVAAGMVHGGPWPSTNRPDTTAVGPLAIERWCRPICFQNAPDAVLPPELQNANPLKLRRLVNGEWVEVS